MQKTQKKVVKMEEDDMLDMYDEFGNYIGPEGDAEVRPSHLRSLN